MSEAKSVISTSVTENETTQDYFALRQLKKVSWVGYFWLD